MKVYKLVTKLLINRGLNTFIVKKCFTVWRVNFLRKVIYGTQSKQGDDLYDLENTYKGINDSLPALPRILTAL